MVKRVFYFTTCKTLSVVNIQQSKNLVHCNFDIWLFMQMGPGAKWAFNLNFKASESLENGAQQWENGNFVVMYGGRVGTYYFSSYSIFSHFYDLSVNNHNSKVILIWSQSNGMHLWTKIYNTCLSKIVIKLFMLSISFFALPHFAQPHKKFNKNSIVTDSTFYIIFSVNWYYNYKTAFKYDFEEILWFFMT